MPRFQMNIVVVFLLISSASFSEFCHKSDNYCDCDDKCIEYGDCCPGHTEFGKIGLLNNIAICKSYSEGFLSKIWIINRCRNPNHHLADHCSKRHIHRKYIFKSFIPVISKNLRIYENYYCAKCNAVTEFRFLNVSFLYNSKMESDIRKANQRLIEDPNNCHVIPYFGELKERMCFPNLIRTCPNISPRIQYDVEDNCTNGKLEIHVMGMKFYRNKYCCDCRNITCKRLDIQVDFPNFSYILNFNEWVETEKEILEIENAFNNLKNITHKHVVDDLVFYTSFIFTCISMISLSLLMFLYITQQIFHNFGGYLTICLSICLWIMNFFVLLVSNSRVLQSPLCKYLAILQHFIALSTFIWMAVYALDLLQTFGLKAMNVKRKTWKTFVVYCAIGFCCAAGFVGTSVIVDFTMKTNSTIRPRYGGVHCWFTNKLGGIIWYFIPVCLLLFWNFGTCVIVFYRLMGTASNSRIAQQNESNSTLWLCIRLTAVFGIGYVFQIIVVLSQVQSLIILGSIINCLQGFLLTICFGCTKRVHSAVMKTLSSMTDNISKSLSPNQQQNTQLSTEGLTLHSMGKTL